MLVHVVDTRLYDRVDKRTKRDRRGRHTDHGRHVVDTEAVTRYIPDIDDIVRLNVVVL